MSVCLFTFATMAGSNFGKAFQLVSFGESHGAAIGGVVEGCPAGLKLDLEAIQQELDRRRPGSTPLGTARNEEDLSLIHISEPTRPY